MEEGESDEDELTITLLRHQRPIINLHFLNSA